jgi:hypothetical protein
MITAVLGRRNSKTLEGGEVYLAPRLPTEGLSFSIKT